MFDPDLDYLYSSFVGCEQPEKWEPEYRDAPMWAHGYYAFVRGLRLGALLSRLLFPDDGSPGA